MAKGNDSKRRAWDILGNKYWSSGYYGGPNAEEISLYLRGATPAVRICVLGASTVELIRAAAAVGSTVSVLDFSAVMLEQLSTELEGLRIETINHDLTLPLPLEMAERFDLVLADRLLNRFDAEEGPRGCAAMNRLLAEGGVLRTKVRLGIYERDLPLMEAGRKDGTLFGFYYPQTQEIDYSQAKHLLGVGLEPHGDIPPEVILKFYFLRGKEKRFTFREVLDLHLAVGKGNPPVSFAGHMQTPAGHPQDVMFEFRRPDPGPSPSLSSKTQAFLDRLTEAPL
jgi:SAM-dependent methyltransferase